MKKLFFYGLFFLFHGISAHTPIPTKQTGSISFTENKGQWNDSILFSAEINGGYINLLNGGFDYTFVDFKKVYNIYHGQDKSKTFDMFWLKVRFLNSNLSPVISKSEASTDYSNYFLGSDQSKWVSKAYDYKKISYQNLYNGIDINIYSKGDHMKYDFIVGTGADISKIKLQYDGSNDINLENGELKIKTGLTDIFELKPVAWQLINGEKVNVDCNYTLIENILGFGLGSNYNPSYPLTIDPEIVFSSYTGSQSDNWGYTATFDDQGNTYAGGIVFNYRGIGTIIDTNKFAVSPGAYQQTFSGGRTDITIFKFNPDGTQRLYGTYLGGTKTDIPESMIVDGLGNLIILGNTGGNFPIANPTNAFDATFNGGSSYTALTGDMDYSNGSDIFLAKLSADGSQLLSSTYIGGSGNDGINVFRGNNAAFYNYGDDYRGEVIVDGKNNILVASTTLSNDFPFKNSFDNTLSGTQDAVVFKLSNNMDTLMFSGYFGGSAEDAAFSVQRDSKGNIFFTGGTLSSDLPTTVTSINPHALGALDGFVCKIDSTGKNLLAVSYLGTSSDDQAFFVQLDRYDKVHILGQTWGNYPVTPGVYKNSNSGQFIHKLSNDLSSTVFSTVFGSGSGDPDISPTAFSVNYCGNILVSGWMGERDQVSSYVNYGTYYYAGSYYYLEAPPVLPSRSMPISPDAYQPKNASSRGFYFCSFSKNMLGLEYGTYFGGLISIIDYSQDVQIVSGTGILTFPGIEHVDGGTSRFDKNGKIYQAICAGCGKSSGFAQTPTTPNVWSPTNQSDNCNELAAKFDFKYIPITTKLTTDPPAVNDTIRGTLPVVSVNFTNQSSKIGPGTTFIWFYNNIPVSNATNQPFPFQFRDMGIVQFKLKGIDTSSCNSGDSTVIYVIVDPTVTGQNICISDSGQFNVLGGYTFNWNPTTGLSNPHIANPKVYVTKDTLYTVEVSNGSYTKDLSIAVKFVDVKTHADFSFAKDSIGPVPLSVTLVNKSIITTTSALYQWSFDDSTGSSLRNPSHQFTEIGRYKIGLITIETISGCVVKDSAYRDAVAMPYVNNVLFCPESPGGIFTVTGGDFVSWQPTTGIANPNSPVTIVKVSHNQDYKILVSNQKRNWDTLIYASASAYPPTIYKYVVDSVKDWNSATLKFISLTKVKTKTWDVGDGKTYTDSVFTVEYDKVGAYPVVISGIDTNNCAYRTENEIEIIFMRIPNVFTPNGDQVNESFAITGLTPGTGTLEVFNRWGSKVFDSGENNYNNNWSADNQADGVYYYNFKLNYRPGKPYKGWVQVVR